MNILLALAYHDRATFEIFGQLELLHHQPLNSFFWLNMVGGSIRLEVPLRFVFSLKLQKDLRTVLAQCTTWLLTCIGTKRFRKAKSQPLKIQPCELIAKIFDQPIVIVYRSILKLH